MYKEIPFSTLLGKTLKEVRNDGNAELVFTTDTGEIFKLLHDQDCCEVVSIEDICGELQDLVGTPIVQAEENSSNDDPPGYKWPKDSYRDSVTWTFYRIATLNGQVVVRWLGESNGYYSESVTFTQIA